MSSVSIRGLKKSYGVVEVIHGLDLDISDGEFVVLVGPSGCGKSTMLRMLAGLETISDGDILIDDRVVNDLAPKDRDIAMVFQNYALYPQMTVAKNMGFSLEMAKMKKADIAHRVREVAEILELTPLLERKPAQLSGGQRQRVAMGRAIVRDPKVFLFDEPLSNLDAKLRVQMRAEIKALHARLGTTIVYVTHDQIEAMTMADKIVVMNGGHIEQVGAPLELFDNPANAFVAGFLGSPSMNFFDAVVAGQKAQLSEGGLVEIPPEKVVSDGQSIQLGIRPEHLRIDPKGGISGRVQIVEPTGTETIIGVTVGSMNVTLLTQERFNLHAGAEVCLSAELSKVHIFDGESGTVINAS